MFGLKQKIWSMFTNSKSSVLEYYSTVYHSTLTQQTVNNIESVKKPVIK